jgi:alginate O-acetyltransferase complex protein AlgI
MAIGIGKMIGFKFPENFNNPYSSQSITEFWRRWHITLGSWMRNYLYIPLGGNKVKSKSRLYFNLWFVFLASGLWHGASWNFVFWGAYHGLFLVLERIFLLKLYEKIGKYFRIIFTFLIVVIGWVFFRIEKFSDALHYLKKMFSFNFSSHLSLDFKTYIYFGIATFFAFFTINKFGEKIQRQVYFGEYTTIRHISFFIICIFLFIFSAGTITGSDFNPFIYFRF